MNADNDSKDDQLEWLLSRDWGTQEQWDDLDWKRVSDEYPWRLAQGLRDFLIESDCPLPLVCWFVNAVDDAKADPKRLLQNLGFVAGTKRPKAGARWTKRMIHRIQRDNGLNVKTELEARLDLEVAAEEAGWSISPAHSRALLRDAHKPIQFSLDEGQANPFI